MFDPNPHIQRLLVIQCGRLLDPKETNITVLYNRTSARLGLAPYIMTTISSGHDPDRQLLRLALIEAARKLREARKLPVEEDTEKLFQEIWDEIGLVEVKESIPSITPTRVGADHLPSQQEMVDDDGNPLVPRRDCPKCQKKGSVWLRELCVNCTEAEGGKYLTIWECTTKGCTYSERSGRSYPNWLNELRPDWKGGTKVSLGIKIKTDNGLK